MMILLIPHALAISSFLSQEFHRMHDENRQLKGICEEQEQALEELGCKLSE